jgi:P27 family predicted phage terminase small subunit
MGQRGPAPTPTPILKLRSSTLVTQKRADAEVKGPTGRPKCLKWLDPAAKAVWKQLIPQLETMGILSTVDRNALARYCQLWARWKKAELFIQQHGEAYPLKDENGKIKYLQPFPQVSIAHKLAALLTRLEHEFGMTPSARARLYAPDAALRNTANADKSRFFNNAG